MYHPHSSRSSIDLYEDVAPPPPAKDSKQLFDELFNSNKDGDEEIRLKKPAITYSRKRQPLLNIRNRHNEIATNYSSDSEEEEDHVQNAKPKARKKGKTRKKKTNYPGCTKDALLKAYQKAIEMNQIPDFKEIENHQLNIVSEKSPVDKIDKLLELDTPSQINKHNNNNIEHSESEVEIIDENENNLPSTNHLNLNFTLASNVISSTPKANVISNGKQRQLRDIANIDQSTIRNDTKLVNTPFRTRIKRSTRATTKLQNADSTSIPEKRRTRSKQQSKL